MTPPPIGTKILQSSGDLSTKTPQELSGSSRSSRRHSQQSNHTESFKCSIKHYSNNFANFKKEKCRDTWRRNTLATAKSQDADSFLNPNYVPSTEKENDILKEKQNFMHSVFSTTLQMDRGKKFVGEHDDDFDA